MPYNENGSWVCPHCEAENTGNFCTGCGRAKPIPKYADVSWACPKCGNVNQLQARYCGKCGKARKIPKKRSIFVPILITILLLLLLAAGAVIWLLLGKVNKLPTAGPTQAVNSAPTYPTQPITAPTQPTTVATQPATIPVIPAPRKEIPQFNIGDKVVLGTYKNGADGSQQQSIQWDVLDVRTGHALLLSSYALDCLPYNERDIHITWEKSDVREWLNHTFLYSAFTDEERECILQTYVDNSSSQGYERWTTNGGKNTFDYVFLLSYAEAKHYFDISAPGTTGPAKSRTVATTYAVARGAFVSDEYKTYEGQYATAWWLRSPGYAQGSAACVHSRGGVGEDFCSARDICIRPAIWVDLYKLK